MRAIPRRYVPLVVRGLVLLLISGIVLAVLVSRAGAGEVAAHLGAADPTWVLAALAAFGIEIAFRLARCILLLPRLPARSAAATWAIGSGVNEVAPAGTGEMARALVGSRWYGIAAADVFAAAAIERVFDVLLLLALAVFAIAAFTSIPPAAAVLVGILGILTGALLLRFGILGRLGSRVATRGGVLGRAGSFAARLDESFAASARRPRALVGAMGLTLAIWALAAIEQVFILRSVGVHVDFGTMAGITGASVLAGFLTLLPGGWGSREAAYTVLLAASGAAYGAVTSGVVALRVMQSAVILTMAAGTAAFVFTRARPPAPSEDVGARSPGDL